MFSSIETDNNKPFSIEHVRKQCVTVFYFWSQQCTLCKSMPAFLERVIDRYGADVQCIAVHDGPLSMQEIKSVKGAIQLIDRNKQLGDLFQLRQVPTLFIFDKNQQLRFKQMGKVDSYLVLRRIEKFL